MDILAGRERTSRAAESLGALKECVAEVVQRRGGTGSLTGLPADAAELLREVFWDLFRTGIIILGLDDANPMYPWFRVSSFGRRLLESQEPYFFHDVSSYENAVRQAVPAIDEVALVYLKEAMQAFMVGCTLSASVMLGVAMEHSFEKLVEAIQGNETAAKAYRNVFSERTFLRRFNKLRNVLQQQLGHLAPDVKEDLDTEFSGILSLIRNYRNESGHPTGRIIGREQCYVLLQLFIPCCRKVYQLIEHFSKAAQ